MKRIGGCNEFKTLEIADKCLRHFIEDKVQICSAMTETLSCLLHLGFAKITFN